MVKSLEQIAFRVLSEPGWPFLPFQVFKPKRYEKANFYPFNVLLLSARRSVQFNRW
jgi:hypothetical protein